MALPAKLQEELIKEQTINDPAVIDLLGLSVSFGRRQILKSLRGDLRGKAIGLLGPNGAGKTTLIHTLLGFYEPTAGSAQIFGHDIVDDARQIKSLVGYMPERDSFIAKMSAVHFVRLMGELSGLPSDAALERAHAACYGAGPCPFGLPHKAHGDSIRKRLRGSQISNCRFQIGSRQTGKTGFRDL